jgi:hypothetical protein
MYLTILIFTNTNVLEKRAALPRIAHVPSWYSI